MLIWSFSSVGVSTIDEASIGFHDDVLRALSSLPPAFKGLAGVAALLAIAATYRFDGLTIRLEFRCLMES